MGVMVHGIPQHVLHTYMDCLGDHDSEGPKVLQSNRRDVVETCSRNDWGYFDMCVHLHGELLLLY